MVHFTMVIFMLILLMEMVCYGHSLYSIRVILKRIYFMGRENRGLKIMSLLGNIIRGIKLRGY